MSSVRFASGATLSVCSACSMCVSSCSATSAADGVCGAMFCNRALCTSLLSSTSNGDKVANAMAFLACGCEDDALASVNEFFHRHQCTTYVCDGTKKSKISSPFNCNGCAFDMERWSVSCGMDIIFCAVLLCCCGELLTDLGPEGRP